MYETSSRICLSFILVPMMNCSVVGKSLLIQAIQISLCHLLVQMVIYLLWKVLIAKTRLSSQFIEERCHGSRRRETLLYSIEAAHVVQTDSSQLWDVPCSTQRLHSLPSCWECLMSNMWSSQQLRTVRSFQYAIKNCLSLMAGSFHTFNR